MFYERLTKDSKDNGFKINPYDPCVANMMVDGEQLTVLWHVDDLTVSQKIEKVVEDFLKWLEKTYGKIRRKEKCR